MSQGGYAHAATKDLAEDGHLRGLFAWGKGHVRCPIELKVKLFTKLWEL
jgi:hypothetical protein